MRWTLESTKTLVKKRALEAMRAAYRIWHTQLEAIPVMRQQALLSESSDKKRIRESRRVKDSCSSGKAMESRGVFLFTSWLQSKQLQTCERLGPVAATATSRDAAGKKLRPWFSTIDGPLAAVLDLLHTKRHVVSNQQRFCSRRRVSL